jgi:hypothetical protein
LPSIKTSMNLHLIDHPHAKSSRIVVRILRDLDMQTVVVVETDLILNPDDPHYDAAAVDGLTDAVAAYITNHQNIDSADDIIPV